MTATGQPSAHRTRGRCWPQAQRRAHRTRGALLAASKRSGANAATAERKRNAKQTRACVVKRARGVPSKIRGVPRRQAKGQSAGGVLRGDERRVVPRRADARGRQTPRVRKGTGKRRAACSKRAGKRDAPHGEEAAPANSAHGGRWEGSWTAKAGFGFGFFFSKKKRCNPKASFLQLPGRCCNWVALAVAKGHKQAAKCGMGGRGYKEGEGRTSRFFLAR